MCRVAEQLQEVGKDQRQALLDEALLDAHKRGLAKVVAALITLGAQVSLVIGPKFLVDQLEIGQGIEEHLSAMSREECQALLDQALLEAANKKRHEAVAALVKIGAKAGVRDKKGRNALGVAINQWQDSQSRFAWRMVHALTPACQDPNEVVSGVPLLAFDCVDERWLLANGANPNARDDQGRPIVHHITHYPDKLPMLHQAGADMFATDSEGRTLLHLELARGAVDSEMLEYFLGLGLDQSDPSWFKAANSCENRAWRVDMQVLLIDQGFPIPPSLPIEAFLLDDAPKGPLRDRVQAELDRKLIDGRTPDVDQILTGDCPRCGRASHPGRCRL